MTSLGQVPGVVRHALEAQIVELVLERGHGRVGHRRVEEIVPMVKAVFDTEEHARQEHALA